MLHLVEDAQEELLDAQYQQQLEKSELQDLQLWRWKGRSPG